MKKIFTSLLILALSLSALAKDYNILLFGHSFGMDCTENLPALIVEAGIDNVRIARIVKGNCSLEEHYKFIGEGRTKGYSVSEPGTTKFVTEPMTVRQAVEAYAWDVVVFQTSLEGEGQYETCQPYLNDLVKFVKKIQKKKFKNSPRFCWNMFWPISKKLENTVKEPHHKRMEPYGHDTNKAYAAYVATAKTVASKMKFDVIPSGTAIMKLRASSANTPEMNEFTRDGYHMSYGVGRYAAACVWFEYLIAPAYKTTVLGNSLRLPDAKVPVTDANVIPLQQAAVDAVADPYNGL